jgi:hypothetical protein
MKKKIKRAVKAFFKPSEKHDVLSLQDQLNFLQERILVLEGDYMQLLCRCAKVESELEFLKQTKDYNFSKDGDIY